MVRIEDRPNVMRVVKPSRPVKVNDWVRLTQKGDYENDVARVTEVRESEGQITVQVTSFVRCRYNTRMYFPFSHIRRRVWDENHAPPYFLSCRLSRNTVVAVRLAHTHTPHTRLMALLSHHMDTRSGHSSHLLRQVCCQGRRNGRPQDPPQAPCATTPLFRASRSGCRCLCGAR